MVSAANRDAVALVERWPDWPSPVVILAGPPGSGKSHLASIWAEHARAVRLAPDRISPGLADAATVLLEDADRPELDQTGLFHLVNAVRARGGHLLLTARRFPAAWGVTLPDLGSRLKAATTVEIHEPDDLLLCGVITKLFADRQVEVEQSVVQFLVRRIERSLSAAMDVVGRLDHIALERKSRITRAMAAELTTEMEQGQFDL